MPDPDLGETEGCSRTNPIYVSAQQNAIVEFGFPIIHDVVDTTLAVGPAGLCQGARFLQEIPGAEVELPRRRVLQGDFRLDSDLLVVGNAYDLILDITNTDPRAIEGVVVALRLSEDASLIPDTVTLDARCAPSSLPTVCRTCSVTGCSSYRQATPSHAASPVEADCRHGCL